MAITLDPAARLRLALWGDPQLTNLAHPDRRRNFDAACESVKNADGMLDALLLAGDIAEFGRPADYDAVAAGLRKAAPNVGRIYAATGNHDVRIRPYRLQLRRFRAFLCDVPHAVQVPYDHYYFADEVKGVPVIVMGADANAFEASWISRAQLSFIDAVLADAEKRGVPAFVLNHQPLKRTNGLPLTWEGKGSWRGSVGLQSAALRRVLTSHGTVFYLTGHLHYGVSEFSVESDGRLHMIASSTVACPNHGPNAAPAQGYILQLYENRLTGTAYNFAQAVPLDPAIPNAAFEIRF